MKFDYEAFIWDTAEHLSSSLQYLHDDFAHIALGASGDVTTLCLEQLPVLDGLISGPPCPPFSAIGLQNHGLDERSAVFEAVHRMICFQGLSGMQFFIVEQVPGQDTLPKKHRLRGETETHYTQWLQRLSLEAPMFFVSGFRLNTCNYHLPQHRERLYTVGVHRSMVTVPVPHPPSLPNVSLHEMWDSVLHPALGHDREEQLTEQQKANLQLGKAMALEKGSWTNPLVISVDRNPLKKFGPMMRFDGLAGCLRTQNELGVWLVWLEQAPRLRIRTSVSFS